MRKGGAARFSAPLAGAAAEIDSSQGNDMAAPIPRNMTRRVMGLDMRRIRTFGFSVSLFVSLGALRPAARWGGRLSSSARLGVAKRNTERHFADEGPAAVVILLDGIH